MVRSEVLQCTTVLSTVGRNRENSCCYFSPPVYTGVFLTFLLLKRAHEFLYLVSFAPSGMVSLIRCIGLTRVSFMDILLGIGP